LQLKRRASDTKVPEKSSRKKFSKNGPCKTNVPEKKFPEKRSRQKSSRKKFPKNVPGKTVEAKQKFLKKSS
jgi:hypothetical protein